jgi:hypothetical protein
MTNKIKPSSRLRALAAITLISWLACVIIPFLGIWVDIRWWATWPIVMFIAYCCYRWAKERAIKEGIEPK